MDKCLPIPHDRRPIREESKWDRRVHDDVPFDDVPCHETDCADEQWCEDVRGGPGEGLAAPH
jgi:hypothetical protein